MLLRFLDGAPLAPVSAIQLALPGRGRNSRTSSVLLSKGEIVRICSAMRSSNVISEQLTETCFRDEDRIAAGLPYASVEHLDW